MNDVNTSNIPDVTAKRNMAGKKNSPGREKLDEGILPRVQNFRLEVFVGGEESPFAIGSTRKKG